MAKRKTIGKNPLDDLVPETLAPATAGEPAVARANVVSGPPPRGLPSSPKPPAFTKGSRLRRGSRLRQGFGGQAGGQAADSSAGQARGKAPEQPRRVTNKSNLQTQYLTFHLAGEEYAVGILQVKEIIEFGALTQVPKTPTFVRGVINLRGNVVPVVDLAVKLSLPETRVSQRTCIVIVEVDLDGELTVMGVMADAVSQVIELQPGDIEAPPTIGAGVGVDYLLGMGKAGNKFVLILDIDKVLSPEELLAAAPKEEGRFIQHEGESTQAEEAVVP